MNSIREGGALTKRISDFVFAIAILAVLPMAPAYAYLDGATVSMILQAITGAVASALIFGKMYWAKLTGFFKRSDDKQPD